MRILHTSDWHLGRTLEGRSRAEEQRQFVDELCGVAEDARADVVLIAGDVFDTYNPPAEAEELFYDAVERLADGGRRAVVAVAGNHDSPDRLCAVSPLASKRGVYLLGKPGDVATPIGVDGAGRRAAGGRAAVVAVVAAGPGWLELAAPGCDHHAVIAVLPYPSEARLNEVLAASLDDEEQLRALYSNRVGRAFAEAATHFREDTVNLAVSHLYMIGGRESDSERQIQLGGALSVGVDALPGQAHYVALGHLHRPQAVTGAPAPCRYSGSPLSYSFSEADQQKEVVLVEAAPGALPLVTPVKLTSGRPLKQWKAKSLDDFFALCANERNLSCWVDLEVHVPAPLMPSQLAEMRARHPGLVNVRVVLPEQAAADDSGTRLSELSLAERFRLFAARQDGAEPDEELLALFLELVAEVRDVEDEGSGSVGGSSNVSSVEAGAAKAGDSVA